MTVFLMIFLLISLIGLFILFYPIIQKQIRHLLEEWRRIQEERRREYERQLQVAEQKINDISKTIEDSIN